MSIMIIFITYFFHRRPTHKLYFLSCRPFMVNATFSKCRVNHERPTGKKKKLVSGTTVEK